MSAIEAPLIALGTAGAMGMTMSAVLHRSETHHAVEYDKTVRQVGKFATWVLSGMNPKEWEVVHLIHHAYTDTEPTSAEWAELQQKYPGAPYEAFRDPHSPILEGHLNVLLKNAPMYRITAKAVMPYLRNLEKKGVPRARWPEHLSGVDLSEDWADKHIYNRKMAGVVGLAVMGVTVAVALDKKTAAEVMAIHVPLVLGVGGIVNSLGHLGVTKNKHQKVKVFFGLQPAIPDENDSYASNFFNGVEGITAGEAKHGDHHKDPSNAFLSSRTNPIRDPSGVVINGLLKTSIKGRRLAILPRRHREYQEAA